MLAHLPQRLRHLVRAVLGFGEVRALRGGRETGFEFLDPVLGRDELLRLARQTLLRDAQELVDLRAPGIVGELQLTPRLVVLQTPVDLLVVGGRVVQLPDELVDALLERVALPRGGDRRLVGGLGPLALLFELGVDLVDRAVGTRQVCLRGQQRAPHLVRLLVRLRHGRGALLDLPLERLDLLTRRLQLVVTLEHALLSGRRLTACGLGLFACPVEVDAHRLELRGRPPGGRLRLDDAIREPGLGLMQLGLV